MDSVAAQEPVQRARGIVAIFSVVAEDHAAAAAAQNQSGAQTRGPAAHNHHIHHQPKCSACSAAIPRRYFETRKSTTPGPGPLTDSSAPFTCTSLCDHKSRPFGLALTPISDHFTFI